MKKKIVLGIAAAGSALALLPMFAAFEAHVINVTAQIENALAVSTTAIDFGTVFPQEHLDQPLTIQLSDSFMAEDRVDDINYFIRQKPKCGVTNADGTTLIGPTWTGHVAPDLGTADDTTDYTIDCEADEPENLDEILAQNVGAVAGLLPDLCPYISKESEDANDEDTPSFHKPFQVVDNAIQWLDTHGHLTKIGNDTVDNWIIDLAVPCFGGECAQDWEDFVKGVNPDALPADQWVLDEADEHKVFGCNLWVEVGEVSLSDTPPPPPPTTATLTVTKTIVNDDAGTIINEEEFSFTLNGGAPIAFEADGSNEMVGLTPGNYDIAEVAEAGYASTIGGDCAADGTITLVGGDDKTCAITNNDNEPVNGTLTITKVIVNDSLGGPDLTASSFSFQVNGGGSTAFEADGSNAVSVPAGTYDVVEDLESGYTTTYANSLNDNLNCDDLDVLSAGNVTCTITNNDISNSGTLTVTKVVTNNNGGDAVIADFALFVDGSGVTSGNANVVSAGIHNVSESGEFGYSATFGGDCDLSGQVNVPVDGDINCTITNDDIAPSITLKKTVVGGTAAPDDFDLSIDGAIKTSGSSNQVTANAAHEIDEEVVVSGYTFTSITGTSFLGVACPLALQGTITLAPGDVVTCTITNTFTPTS